MRKILISTLYNGLNCGAYLQAYSLKTFLEKNNNSVYFFKGGARKPLMMTMIDALKSLKHGNIHRAIYLFKQFYWLNRSCRNFKLTKSTKGFECFISGSDEVWNLRRKEIYDYPYLWGEGIDVVHKISYAPSMGFSSKSDVENAPGFLSTILEYSNISVRDSNSFDIIRSVSGREPSLVLDPTFLIEHPRYQCADHDYILIYAYSVYVNPAYQASVLEFANRHKKKIYTMGAYCDWGDRAITNSPENFLKYISNASYVFTDTFHGSVFSIIYNKNFVAFSTDGNDKVRSLLSQFSLNNRVYLNGSLDDITKEEIDYCMVNSIKSDLVAKSQSYLLTSILGGKS